MIGTLTWIILIGGLLIGLVSVTGDRPKQREVDLDALGRPEVPAEAMHLPDPRPKHYKGNRRRR